METALVFDIGGTSIKSGVFGPSGALTAFRETPTNAREGGAAVLRRVIGLARESGMAFTRVGVSTAGQVDPRAGRITFATDNIPGYTGTPVKALLEEALGVPAAVLNDVSAAALGELRFGAARGLSDFLCVTFGTGIGGAVVAGGRLYTGARGSAGEFGHFVTHAGGEECTCGGRGCYEAYASTAALSRRVQRATGQQLSGREIFEQIAGGDGRVETCLEEWLDEAALGLGGLVHLFDPEAVVLGGGIMQEPRVQAGLAGRVGRLVMASYHEVRLLPAALGNRAGLYGAYAAAMDASSPC